MTPLKTIIVENLGFEILLGEEHETKPFELLGQYPFPLNDGVVPGSDGAGEVIAVGPKVTRFQ